MVESRKEKDVDQNPAITALPLTLTRARMIESWWDTDTKGENMNPSVMETPKQIH